MSKPSSTVFDNHIIDQLVAFAPPDDDVEQVNPWAAPIESICWGLILSTIHINALYLQYILPSVGIMLVYLGFRSLRHINKWFRIAWVLSVVQMMLQLLFLAFISLPFFESLQNLPAIFIVYSLFYLGLFLTFRKALQVVFLNAGVKQQRDPLLWASIWTVLISICAIPPLATNIFVLVPLVIFYFFIIRSLFSVGKELNNVGYRFTNAPVKTSKTLVGIGYLFSCLILVIGCTVYGNHVPVDASVYPEAENTQIASSLVALGAPASSLSVLSEESLYLLSDTIIIETDSADLTFPNSLGPEHSRLNATTVFFRQPNHDLYILVYFDWQKGSALWNDGFYIMSPESFQLLEGSLVYEKNGTRYQAPIPRLYSGVMTQNSFLGASAFEGISGGVSYPFKTKNQQGYVFYYQSAAVSEYAWSGFNYAHYTLPLRLPYRDPEQLLLEGAGNSANHYAASYPPAH